MKDYDIYEVFGVTDRKGTITVFEKNGWLIKTSGKNIKIHPSGKYVAIKQGTYSKQ